MGILGQGKIRCKGCCRGGGNASGCCMPAAWMLGVKREGAGETWDDSAASQPAGRSGVESELEYEIREHKGWAELQHG